MPQAIASALEFLLVGEEIFAALLIMLHAHSPNVLLSFSRVQVLECSSTADKKRGYNYRLQRYMDDHVFSINENKGDRDAEP
jgi:hypothetical protein